MHALKEELPILSAISLSLVRFVPVQQMSALILKRPDHCPLTAVKVDFVFLMQSGR